MVKELIRNQQNFSNIYDFVMSIFKVLTEDKSFYPKLTKQFNTVLDTFFIFMIFYEYLCIINHHYSSTLKSQVLYCQFTD